MINVVVETTNDEFEWRQFKNELNQNLIEASDMLAEKPRCRIYITFSEKGMATLTRMARNEGYCELPPFMRKLFLTAIALKLTCYGRAIGVKHGNRPK